jgi:hypothetical protein
MEKRVGFQGYDALGAFHNQTSALARFPAPPAFGLSHYTTGRNTFRNFPKLLRRFQRDVKLLLTYAHLGS